MTIELSEDVILDLMPLYLGQSASPATRRIVEDYLAAHPQTAGRLAAQAAGPQARAELLALRHTRSAIRQRDFNMAFAIACTVAPLAFWYDAGTHATHLWIMLRDLPSLAFAFWVMAAGFWIGFAVWARRTRATGL